MRNFNITVDGKSYSVQIDEVGSVSNIQPVPAQAQVTVPAKTAVSGASKNKVLAPMPGTLIKFMVETGSFVKKGDVVAVIEAMKMENDIVSPQDGTVTLVAIKGATLNSGDVLATIN